MKSESAINANRLEIERINIISAAEESEAQQHRNDRYGLNFLRLLLGDDLFVLSRLGSDRNDTLGATNKPDSLTHRILKRKRRLFGTQLIHQLHQPELFSAIHV
jgi:hypothetical protein